jgi:hypothetical protein
MFRVKCPACNGVLTIDPRSRKVVSHLTREQADQAPSERLEDLMDRVKQSKSGQESRLEEAKQREADRKNHLDSLFDDAQKKAKESDDENPLGPTW